MAEIAEEKTTETVEQKEEPKKEVLTQEEIERKLANKTEEAARVHKKTEALEKELEKYKKAEEERKLAEMSEVERLKAEQEKLQASLLAKESEYQAKERENKIIAIAHKLGFADVQDAVLFTKEQEGETLDAAVERLANQKQYLISKKNPQAGNILVDAATAIATEEAKKEEFLKRMGLRRGN